MKDFLIALLGKTLNMAPDKVAALFNADGTELLPTALNEILTADATRVQTIKAENQTYFDNGFKKAQVEVLSKSEKDIKAKFAIVSDKVGLDLIDEIVTLKAGEKANLEPDKVKLHPEYLKLQDELTNKLKESETSWKTKYDTREAEIGREKTFAVISKKADALLSGYGLPEDEKLRDNQKKLLHLELNKYGFQQHNDDFVIVDADGKPVNDEHGHRKNFDTLVQEIASQYWPKLEGQGKSGSGAQNNGGQGAGAAKLNPYKGKIKSEQDYISLVGQAKTAEERIAIKAEFDLVNGG